MARPKIETVLMNCALQFAERSTCQRVKAGAVIAVENHIVSTGYNGNAPGQEHCSEHFRSVYNKTHALTTSIQPYEEWITTDEFRDMHREWAIVHELHAEMNAIIYASRHGIPIAGGDIYTTYSPCIFCTKAIIHAGLKRVFYHNLYDRPEGLQSLDILDINNIKAIKE